MAIEHAAQTPKSSSLPSPFSFSSTAATRTTLATTAAACLARSVDPSRCPEPDRPAVVDTDAPAEATLSDCPSRHLLLGYRSCALDLCTRSGRHRCDPGPRVSQGQSVGRTAHSSHPRSQLGVPTTAANVCDSPRNPSQPSSSPPSHLKAQNRGEKWRLRGSRAPVRPREHPARGRRQPLEFTQQRAVLDTAESPTAAESAPLFWRTRVWRKGRVVVEVEAIPAELLLHQ